MSLITHYLILYYFSNDHRYKALDRATAGHWFAEFKEEVKESERKGRGKEEEEKTKKEEEENAVDKGILDDSTNRKKLASYLSHFTSTSTRRRRKRNFASSLNFIYELIYEIII